MHYNHSAKKIAVIGGGGFVGSSVFKALRTINSDTVYTSRSDLISNYSKNFMRLDLFDKSSWDMLINEFKPNVVICVAWETEHDKYWNKATNFDYMNATIDFATTCLKGTVDKFIGFGSMSEYGFSPGKCNADTTLVNPQDSYSEAKVLTSIALNQIADDLGKKANWVRLFQPYGMNEKPDRLIPTLIKNIINDTPITVKFPDHTLDFIHINDVADAVKLIATNDFNYSVNVGTGVATSIRGVCSTLGQISGYDLNKITFNKPDQNYERIVFVDPEHDIFKKWQHKFNLFTGLKQTFMQVSSYIK
jgi:nucleoside-diphosphate-sugar epimerase